MKKLIKNEICGDVNSAQMYCSRKTGQMLRLLFIYSTWTLTACEGENAWKKKKEGENVETEMQRSKRQPKHTHRTVSSEKIWRKAFSWFFFFSRSDLPFFRSSPESHGLDALCWSGGCNDVGEGEKKTNEEKI